MNVKPKKKIGRPNGGIGDQDRSKLGREPDAATLPSH
jgi:hypothetical protein